MSRHVVVRQGVPPLAARLWGAPVRVQEENRTPLGVELQQSNSRTQRSARARAEARGATPDASRSGIASPRLEPRGPCRGPVFVEGPRGVAPVARPRARSAPVRNALARAVACAETQVSALGMVAVGFQRANKRSGFDTGSPGALALVNDRPVRSSRVACLPVPRARNARDARVAEMRASPSRRPVPCGGARLSLARADGVITKPIPRSGHRSRARSSTICLVFFRREQCVGSARKEQTL